MVIHHIIAKDTIDEDVMLALKLKDKTQASLIDAVKARLEEKMISVLEKRYALRKELRADLDFYLKQSKEHPEYQISEDIQESI